MSKPFINKKDRVVYTLFSGSAFDRHGREINELVQKEVDKKIKNKDSGEEYYDDEDEDGEYDDEDYDYDEEEYYDDEEEDVEEAEQQQESNNTNKKEEDDLHLLGFKRDGYNYNKHLKPIGGGIFIPAVYDLNDLKKQKNGIVELVKKSEPAPYMYGLEDISKHYVKNENELVGVDNDLIEALGSEGEFEDLDDDFILQANGGNLDGLDEEVSEAKRKLKTLDLYDDEDEYDLDVDEQHHQQNRVVDEFLEEQFDAALEEYDDDDIGELDKETTRGKYSTDQFTDVFDEFMQDYQKNRTPFIDQFVQLKREDPTIALTEAEKMAIVERDWDKTDSESDESEQEKEVWDCETILTTYTDIYNHPKTLREEGIKRITLSRKTGIPLGVLPTRPRQEESDEEEPVNLGEAIDPNESKDEKKARKKAVKELKKMARGQKKELKDAFKSEQLKQTKVMRAQKLNKALAVQF